MGDPWGRSATDARARRRLQGTYEYGLSLQAPSAQMSKGQ